jgi:hypothetical protein
MSKIFVRERRHIGQGAGRPRFALVAVEGANLKVLAPHLRKSELEALAAAVEAEVIYLPRGEKAGEQETGGEGGRRRRKGRQENKG